MRADKPLYRRWNPPVETPIADIHGWLQDIQSTHELASRLYHELDFENPDHVLLDALSTAAVIRYGRCFTTGIRARLSFDMLPETTIEESDFHERLRGIRDWHIAHPINKQEVHALYVILDGSLEANTGAIGFSSFSSVELTLQPFEVYALIALCEKWIPWLKDQLIQEQTSLISEANRLSREELLALPSDEPRPNSNIGARRQQTKW